VTTHAAPILPAPRPHPPGEQRIVVHGVDWKTYLLLNDAIDTPGVRMAYCEGALEIMTVGPEHEVLKKMLARLLELYAIERNVPLHGYGNTTFRREAKERGLEPDECYVLGGPLRDYPDLAIEVALTSGGIDKLEIYRGLGVREVWFWRNGAIEAFGLTGDAYAPIARSAICPDLDLGLLSRFVPRTDQHAAVLEFRAALRADG
jgi:Uma2 family endonuclease